MYSSAFVALLSTKCEPTYGVTSRNACPTKTAHARLSLTHFNKTC